MKWRRNKHPLRRTPIRHASQNPDVFSRSSQWKDQLTPGGIGGNTNEEKIISRKSVIGIMAVSTVLFVGLLVQLAYLQVVEGERLRGIAEGNRVREQVTFAPRGRILDRNGVVLAKNTASFQLSATPYQLPDKKEERARMYQRVAGILDTVSVDKIVTTIDEKGLSHPQPVLIEDGVSHKKALQLEYILPELHGFRLSSVPERQYKSEAALAHVLGYVGRISEADLEENPQLHPLDFIGRTGVEDTYDQVLRGQNGVIETEVDARGRPLRTLRERETRSGEDLRLTIDFTLQKRLHTAIRKQMRKAGVTEASGVIMDPDTGEVLAMVSIPSFDNNKFAGGIKENEFRKLVNNPAQPMLNRVVAAGYPSGSVIKPIVLLGALDTGTVTENTIIHDRGEITVRSQYDPSVTFTYEGWDPSGLGAMNARRAIAMSSNIYFYTVAGGNNDIDGMGIDNLTRYMKMFGLGSRTGIDLPNETAGRVPTPAWKKKQFDKGWYTGDTYNLAIGQGNLLVSPLQMARAHAAIANDGKLLKPQLNLDSQTEVVSRPSVQDYYFRVAQEGMREVVTNGTTSPSVFADVGVPVAGKSGTAESNPGVRKSHAWYSAYAPYGDPELQGMVLLEEGEGGSQYAAPALAEAFEWHFRTENN